MFSARGRVHVQIGVFDEAEAVVTEEQQSPVQGIRQVSSLPCGRPLWQQPQLATILINGRVSSLPSISNECGRFRPTSNFDRFRPIFNRFRPIFDRFRPILDRFRPILDRFRPIFDRFRPIFDRFCPGLLIVWEIILHYTQN